MDGYKTLSLDGMGLGCWQCYVHECGVLRAYLPLPSSRLGAPFYRLRRGTRLHGIGARVGFDRGMGAGKLEASIPAWLEGSCYVVIGEDGACVP